MILDTEQTKTNPEYLKITNQLELLYKTDDFTIFKNFF